ncbi:hypothetical protein ACQKM9_12775 [Viridibacillus sp. NPDC093762]|uniref:hypothetical protein n=1 Tax=Viridibacillus sp. NPDC093762 TaxID=3390720 RepID=UPI003D08FDCE
MEDTANKILTNILERTVRVETKIDIFNDVKDVAEVARDTADKAANQQTSKSAILIEICFVDSAANAKIYSDKFEEICQAIASFIAAELGYKKKEVTTVSKPSKPVSKPSTAKSYYKLGTGLYRIKKLAIFINQ